MFEGLFFDVFGVVLLSEVGKFMAHPSKCLSVGAPHFLASFLYLLTYFLPSSKQKVLIRDRTHQYYEKSMYKYSGTN